MLCTIAHGLSTVKKRANISAQLNKTHKLETVEFFIFFEHDVIRTLLAWLRGCRIKTAFGGTFSLVFNRFLAKVSAGLKLTVVFSLGSYRVDAIHLFEMLSNCSVGLIETLHFVKRG